MILPGIKDDRTPDQKVSLDWAVVATDPFMGNWASDINRDERRGYSGPSNLKPLYGNGYITSYAAWACTYEQLRDCLDYVEGRSDMKRARVVKLADYRLRSNVNLHIYVYDNPVRLRGYVAGECECIPSECQGHPMVEGA